VDACNEFGVFFGEWLAFVEGVFACEGADVVEGYGLLFVEVAGDSVCFGEVCVAIFQGVDVGE
jgi:hypothetical protein